MQEGQKDEEEGAGALSREEGLDRAAALARAAPSSTLPALAEAISQRQQQLQQCASTGNPWTPKFLKPYECITHAGAINQRLLKQCTSTGKP